MISISSYPGQVPQKTYALEIFQSMQFWAQTSMNAQELFVHYCSKRERTKRLHASFINVLRVFVLALELECEVVGQMSAFVVSAKKPERVRVPDLQRPEVEDALCWSVLRFCLFSKLSQLTSILK